MVRAAIWIVVFALVAGMLLDPLAARAQPGYRGPSMGGGGGGGYRPQNPSPPSPYGGRSPSYSPGPQPYQPNVPGHSNPYGPNGRSANPYGAQEPGGPYSHGHGYRPPTGPYGYDPGNPGAATVGRPYVPDPPTTWSVRNPLATDSRILPDSGHVDLSHTVVAPPGGSFSPEVQRMRHLAQHGNLVEVERQISRQLAAGEPRRLDTMFATVNALHGVRNPKYQELRSTTLQLAQNQIAQGTTDAMPWVVVAQMSLQDRNQRQFEEATRRLVEQHPDDKYAHFFSGVQHLQNRDYRQAQAALERARALGMPEESIAELLKTAVDNQKWIWQYAAGLLIVVAVWLVGLAALYVVGIRLSQRTLSAVRSGVIETPARELRLRRRYRLLIRLAGMYYYLSLPIVLAVALGLPPAIGYVVLSVPYLNLPLLIGVLVLGAAGVVTAVSGIRTALLRIPSSDDARRLRSSEAPELWAVVREVAEKVGTRPVDEIRLMPGSDCGVFELGSFRQRMRDRGRRVLVLGVGFLEGLKLDAFRAVLAHEYGHFQHRDTAGGDIALRVYGAMDQFASAVVRRGAVRRWDVALRFLILYHAIFRRFTFGASRLQEILADRLAVAHYGAQAFCDGLRHAVRRSIELDWALSRTLDDVVRTRRAVTNFYAARPQPNLAEREAIETTFVEVLSRPGDDQDSHPGPEERFRLAAACVGADRPAIGEPADKLLASHPELLEEMNHLIVGRIGEHAKATAGECLAGIRALSNLLERQANYDALFERAKLHAARGDDASAIADLSRLIQAVPDAALLRYMRGAALLRLKRGGDALLDLQAARTEMTTHRQNSPKPTETFDDQSLTQVLLKMAECLTSLKRHKEAVAMYGEALRITPHSFAGLMGRGRIYFQARYYPQALADFTAAATHWPAAPEPAAERSQVQRTMANPPASPVAPPASGTRPPATVEAAPQGGPTAR